MIDPVEFGTALGDLIHEVIEPIRARLTNLEAQIKSVSVTKALDLEAFDELAVMAERLESLEASLTQVSKGGLNFRGKWSPLIEYQKGDIVTVGGVLWHANEATKSPPGERAYAWERMLKAYKADGRGPADFEDSPNGK